MEEMILSIPTLWWHLQGRAPFWTPPSTKMFLEPSLAPVNDKTFLFFPFQVTLCLFHVTSRSYSFLQLHLMRRPPPTLTLCATPTLVDRSSALILGTACLRGTMTRAVPLTRYLTEWALRFPENVYVYVLEIQFSLSLTHVSNMQFKMALQAHQMSPYYGKNCHIKSLFANLCH